MKFFANGYKPLASEKFDSYLVEKLLKDSEQAVEYLKLAIEEGDLELLKMSTDNLIKAGYKSYTITPINLIQKVSIEFNQQTIEASTRQ